MKTEITDCIWGINVGHWTFRGYCVFEEFEDSVARDCWPAGAVAEDELDSSSASFKSASYCNNPRKKWQWLGAE